MKSLLLMVAVMTFSGIASAHESEDGVMTVRSKDYTCEGLKGLVQEEGTVHVKWIGSIDVHASAEACSSFREEAYQTSWKTQDKFFCIAGYSCRKLHDRD